MIDVAAKVFGVILLKTFQYERDQRTRPNQSSLGLDVDARIRCTTCVAHWSSVGASSKLMLCASLILLLRSIPWTGAPYGGGRNAPQSLEADQGVLLVDQDEG